MSSKQPSQPKPKETKAESPGCNIFCHLATHSHEPPKGKPIVWILGGPGVGKGAQCHKIVNKYGFTHLSTGDLLRAEVKTGSERGKKLEGIIARGELAPNDVVLDLLKAAIAKHDANSKGFLIDGYPRERHQGEAFEKAIAEPDTIIFFSASEDTLRKRIMHRVTNAKEKRLDDTEEAVEVRMIQFRANNEMVLAQYPHKLTPVNAERTVDEIFEDVGTIIDPIISLHRAI